MDEQLFRDDDGDIGIDWQTENGDMLSLRLSDTGRLSYAWCLNSGVKGHGASYLPQEAFLILAKLTPNVEVQRDSGGIIAGGSAGTTGYASAVKTEEDK